jgi:hypothetical protein
MRNSFRKFTLTALLLPAAAIFAAAQAQQVPPDLRPPPNEQLVVQVHATGDQIYTCQTDGSQGVWKLKAPDAQLSTDDGKVFGKHYAGPSWEAKDGSKIIGKATANAASPDADAIPWLLVTVVSHAGKGVLSPVTSIQRLNTKGGKAPADSCETNGQEVRVPYSADYLFFAPK